MASWSTRRKSLYFLVFAVIVILAIGIPSFLVFYKAPTCTDGKQNGSERGIDCGGSCPRLCPADFSMPRVLWSYSMKVAPGVYNSLAYIQNPNPAVETPSLPYIFRVYDDQGILITERKGSTFIPAGQKFAIFEGGLQSGQRIPFRTTFEFTGEPEWRPGAMLTKLRTLDVELDQGVSPKASARVKNDAVDRGFSGVDAFIILYDKNDNRVAFSKTLIERIAPDETQTVYFTWPLPFSTGIVRTEVLFVDRPSR